MARLARQYTRLGKTIFADCKSKIKLILAFLLSQYRLELAVAVEGGGLGEASMHI